MALDDILGNLVVEKDGQKKASDKYSSKFLITASDSFENLKVADIKTPEGLEVYKTITGDNPDAYSPQVLDIRKRAHLDKQDNLGIYVNRHFESLVGELDESIKPQLAYAYCPTKDISGEAAKNYNNVRKVVSDAKEKIQKIESDPEAYLIEEMKKEKSLIMKGYLSRYAKELITQEKSNAQRNALLTIQKYGATKFLKDTKKHSETQMTKLREEQSALETKMKTKIDAAGTGLTPTEYATLISDDYKKSQKLSEEYVGAEIGSKLTQDVASYAIRTIKEKSNKTKKD